MIEYLKNPGVFLIAIGAFCTLIGSIILGFQDNVQKDNIEELSKINNELGNEIKKLQEANVQVTNAIEDITKENLVLTNKSNDLIDEVKNLTTVAGEVIDKIDKRTLQNVKENILAGEFDFSGMGTIYPETPITIILGSNTVRLSGQHLPLRASQIISFGGAESFFFKVKDGKFCISTDIVDHSGNFVLKVVDNAWHRNPNFTGSFNYDNKGFEIMDNGGHVIFSIDLREDKSINVQGVFFDSDQIQIFGDHGTTSVRKTDEYKHKIKDYIAQIFSYTGNDWLGKRR